MWAVPLVAVAVAMVFAIQLGRQYTERRHPYQLAWAMALLMFAAASMAVVLGLINHWSRLEFQIYWAFGAVLTVPFLAAGEVLLLFRKRGTLWAVWLILVFVIAYTVAVLRGAEMSASALAEQLPSGKDVFGDGSAAHRLPQVIAYPSYFILLAGALWSAWRMRGRPELKDRFVGTLLVAVGATVVAAGATFAALGLVPGFIATLVIGIVVMYWGFLRASRRPAPARSAPAPAAPAA
jgi:hypothetical protein